MPDGGKAELNRGNGTTPSFLWYHDGPGKGDPIVDLIISHSESSQAETTPPTSPTPSVPDGYEKLNKNILKGGPSKHVAYIYFKRGKDKDPISELRLLYNDDPTGIARKWQNQCDILQRRVLKRSMFQ